MNWNMIQHAGSFFGTSPIPTTDLVDLLNNVNGDGTVAATLESVTNPDFFWNLTGVRDIGTPGSISITAANATVGTTAGDCSNSATSARVYWEIGNIPTFKRKGWMDVPGVLDANSVANELTVPAQADYTLFANALLNAIAGSISGPGFWTPVVVSKFFGSGGGTPGHPVPHPRPNGVYTPIIGHTTRPKVAGRSDRLRGGRRHR